MLISTGRPPATIFVRYSDKPERAKTGKRIDAVPTTAMALAGWKLRGQKIKPARMVVMG